MGGGKGRAFFGLRRTRAQKENQSPLRNPNHKEAKGKQGTEDAF